MPKHVGLSFQITLELSSGHFPFFKTLDWNSVAKVRPTEVQSVNEDQIETNYLRFTTETQVSQKRPLWEQCSTSITSCNVTSL